MALALVASTSPAEAFQCTSNAYQRSQLSSLSAAHNDEIVENNRITINRREIINNVITGGLLLGAAGPAYALIEGNVPPTKTKVIPISYLFSFYPLFTT